MSNRITLAFSETIKSKIPGMYLGNLIGGNLTVRDQSALVGLEIQSLVTFIKHKFAVIKPSADPVVSSVRRMYRRIGWEPTQYRPSSEAMIRRIIKGTGLYQVNNLVDLANITSTRYHLPMGLYDLKKVNGIITVDVGKADETYQGIFKDLIHAEGKLILRDRTGIFGNPTADSARTCIDENTTDLLATFFTPPEVEYSYLEQTFAFMLSLYQQECPGCRIEFFCSRIEDF